MKGFRLTAIALLLVTPLALPLNASAQDPVWDDDPESPWFAGVGLGGGSVKTHAPAPSAGRRAITASVEIGYRIRPQWSLGLELGTTAPLDGCAEYECQPTASDFSPNFGRIFAFSEFQPRHSGLRLRVGAGASRFCYHSEWDDGAWSWGDTLSLLLDAEYDDERAGGSGAYRCKGRRYALGGAASLGYDWRLNTPAPMSMGVRLNAEFANYDASPSIGLGSFRHRAVTLTLHLNLN